MFKKIVIMACDIDHLDKGLCTANHLVMLDTCACEVIIKRRVMPLKLNFPINFLLIFACDLTHGLLYYPMVMLHTCTVIWKSKGECDHDLAKIRDR